LEKKGFNMLEKWASKPEPAKRSPMELVTPTVPMPGGITLKERMILDRLRREANPTEEASIDPLVERARKFQARFP